MCPWPSHLLSWPFGHILGPAAPSFPTTRPKTGRTEHVFAAQGGTHRFPSGNKRCFLNGVFQSGVFRGWSGSARAERTKMLKNTAVFRHSLSPSRVSFFSLSQAEVRNLKNTVWKTPFGTLRNFGGSRRQTET